jgi:hypothetical protein
MSKANRANLPIQTGNPILGFWNLGGAPEVAPPIFHGIGSPFGIGYAMGARGSYIRPDLYVKDVTE